MPGFSKKESIIILFLSVSLLIGLGLKYARLNHWGIEPTKVISTGQEKIRYRIDINTADQNELMLLPGIGEQKAMAIVNYRKKHGDFRSINELSEIKGLGESILNSIKDLITIGRDRTTDDGK